MTGNKPEINNKPNMTTEVQYIIPNQQYQMNQWFRQKLPENAYKPEK